MRLIKPSFEIIEQKPGMDGLLQHIERCGRTCYKSEDKITGDSAEKFVNMLVNRGHTAMVEHGTVYLRYDFKANDDSNTVAYRLWSKYNENQYSKAVQAQPVPGVPDGFVAITTNYRVLLQNGWLDDLQYLCEPTEHHVRRVTVKFVCDRGVSHEFVRHRVFSFAQESTRYCNYSKDKFGGDCTFIIPSWLSDSITMEGRYVWHSWCGLDTYGLAKDCFPSEEEYKNRKGTDFACESFEGLFMADLHSAEFTYLKLLEKGWKPQQARAVLPNSLKTELIMTGTLTQWEGFFKLRDAESAHPQARELAEPLHAEFRKRGWLE